MSKYNIKLMTKFCPGYSQSVVVEVLIWCSWLPTDPSKFLWSMWINYITDEKSEAKKVKKIKNKIVANNITDEKLYSWMI